MGVVCSVHREVDIAVSSTGHVARTTLFLYAVHCSAYCTLFAVKYGTSYTVVPVFCREYISCRMNDTGV